MNRKPNVIFIFSDQHRANACGYTGNNEVHTPHLDSFAKESIDFSQAISGMPVCCPYRATLMTGQYPHHHGVFLNDVPMSTDISSLAEVYRDHGYDTAYIGKWHIDGYNREGYIPPERRRGFEYWKALECTHNYNHSPYYEGNNPEKKYWEGYDAIAQCDDVIHYLQTRAQDKPLFLMLSWGPPHMPYDTAPERYRRLYSLDKITRPPNVPLEASQFFRCLPGYYAHITALDDCFGRIKKVIDELGMTEDTILVYTSDHGDMIGSQGIYEKQSPWDESNHVPFLLRFPALYGDVPQRIDTPIGAVDIMPTLLDLCGLPCPETVDGSSFKKMMDGEDPGDNAILLQCLVPNGTWHKNTGGREYRGIRTRKYTYVEDLQGPWLLFDNAKDPYQINNFVTAIQRGRDPGGEKADLLKHLKSQLYKKLEETGDAFIPSYECLEKWQYDAKVNFLDTYPIAW